MMHGVTNIKISLYDARCSQYKDICTLSLTTSSHKWPEHDGGHYTVKLHHKTKVHLLVSNKFYVQDTSLMEPCCHQQYILRIVTAVNCHL
jgi:hypothetical protein